VIRKRSSWSTVPSRSFLHWSGPQLSFPAGDIWKVVIVYKVRFQNRMPLRSWAAMEELTSQIRSRQTTRRASSPLVHGCQQAALTRAEPVDFVALSKFFAGVKSGGSTNAKNDGCGRLVAGIGSCGFRLQRRQVDGNPDVSLVSQAGVSAKVRLPLRLRCAVTRCWKLLPSNGCRLAAQPAVLSQGGYRCANFCSALAWVP
jgi:hypothetical protein